MYRSEPFPVKKIFLWLIVVMMGLAVSLGILISVVSIKIGLSNMNQEGFFIPVLAGVFLIALSLFLFIWVIKFIINLMREKDIIRSSG